jgi:phage shock protein A
MPNLLDHLKDIFVDLFDASRLGRRSGGGARIAQSLEAPLSVLNRTLQAALQEHQAAAVALAQATVANRREATRLDDIGAQIADIEARAILALRGGRTDLAERSAETIAALEAQQTAQARVCAETTAAMQTLQAEVETGRLRLQKLHHGRQIATIRAAASSAQFGPSQIEAAEDALAGVTAVQEAAALTRSPNDAGQIVEALGEAGFGSSRRTVVDAVMSRLMTAARVDVEPSSQPTAAKLIGQTL